MDKSEGENCLQRNARVSGARLDVGLSPGLGTAAKAP